MEIFIRRIWPAPRWPLVHQARRAFEAGGEEALVAWLESLCPEEVEELSEELLDLLGKAVRIAVDSVIEDLKEGRIKL